MLRKIYLSFSFLFLFNQVIYGQQNLSSPPDPLEQQFYFYKQSRPAAILFVHFDKNIYTNNETAWFTGYLLNERLTDISKHNILSVALIRDIDSTIIKHQKFIMAEGLSYGSMTMPDSILAGNYHFLVSTNRVSNGLPDVSYVQPIILKTNTTLPFNANVKILEPGIPGKKPTNVLLSVTTPDARFLPKPVTVNSRYGNITQTSKTNSSGELILKLDEQENLIDPNVYLKLIYGKDSSFLNLALPVKKQKAKVSFFPEGGNMVNGTSGTIGWEVKDQQLAVMTLKAELYKNDQIIDTIETSHNGIGRFILTPTKGSSYKVKLMHSGLADSIYMLPAAIDDHGLGLSIVQAATTDTLRVNLKTRHKIPIFIRVHNYKETFVYNSIDLKNPGLSLKISLENVPRGLNTITILDSLGRPIAERLFFAHYDPSKKISLSTSQPTYRQREKVSLSINLNKLDSLAMVSIACVSENRLPHKLISDIETYNYLTSQINALPPYNNTRGYEDPNYLEDVLLVKGWSRYTWTDLIKAKAADTLIEYDNTTLSLTVSELKKPIIKAIGIALLSPKGLNFFTTDDQGNFDIPLKNLIVEKEKPVYIFIADKRKEKYRLHAKDPYTDLNKNYLKVLFPKFRSIPSTIENNRLLSLKSSEGAFQLKEVQIKAGTPEIQSRLRGSNRCGDYVCSYNILNCMNHVGDYLNTQPIPGKMYNQNGRNVIYKACVEDQIVPGMLPIEGVYTKKEFYVNDYPEPLEPAFASTLYWNYGELLTNKTKEITFHTSDITGKFRIIIQGITTDGVVYGDCTFEVKGK